VQGYFFSRPIPAADVEAFLGKATDPGRAPGARSSLHGAEVDRPARAHYVFKE
jgi:hypothetical protein